MTSAVHPHLARSSSCALTIAKARQPCLCTVRAFHIVFSLSFLGRCIESGLVAQDDAPGGAPSHQPSYGGGYGQHGYGGQQVSCVLSFDACAYS